MSVLKDRLDQIASQYLLEDFAELTETLAQFSRGLTQPENVAQAEQLQSAARELLTHNLDADAEDAGPNGARARFEAALQALQHSLLDSAETLAAPSGTTSPSAAQPETVVAQTTAEQSKEVQSNEPNHLSTSAAPVSAALSQDPELVGDFLLEAREHLVNIENGLLIIEKDRGHGETLHSVFRSFHTIKGLAGFLEFSRIQDVAHEVETLLDLARNRQLEMTPSLIDLTLHGADFIQKEINRIEAELRGDHSSVFEESNSELLSMLRDAAQIRPAKEEKESKAGKEAKAEKEGTTEPVVQPAIQSAIPTASEASPVAAQARSEEHSEQSENEKAPSEETPARSAAPVEAPRAEKAASRSTPPGSPAAASRRGNTQESYAIRVDTAKLDYLLDMVGEMVIAESMVRLDPGLASMKSARLQRNLTQLRRVTEEVQKIAMATRMLPIGSLFQRVNRLVRDTSRKAGKLAEVEFFGEETQLDKTIIEELTDPIMHMVRNSIDHGIESPEQRNAVGKAAAGKIQLKAYRQADHIQIEIVDDGRGLNKDRILAKALERGLVSEGAALQDSEIFQLIFEPGFSTAEKVTDLSGRGVGMDVVKKQIQKLRGKIEIQSAPGQGTTFYLKLPLTLAIIEGLVVGVGRERFIVPIFSVQEMFRPTSEQVSTVHGKGEMVMVRNHLLPVVRLEDSLQVKGSERKSADGLMIVAETEGKRFVLVVDEFIGKQEVVIKSLGESLKNTPGVAGGAILGDGRVGLILDLESIYRDRPEKLHVPKEGETEEASTRRLMQGQRKESVCVQELVGSLN